MNSWGLLYYFSLSMCSELCLSDFAVSLFLSYVCVFHPCISRQILFLAFCRGIKATRDHGYAVYSNFLWLVDECDCVCLPHQNCGQKVWDAWNSWDRVLPIWPNTTSFSALLIPTTRLGRQTCKIPWKARGGILFDMQRPFFTFCPQIEHKYQL